MKQEAENVIAKTNGVHAAVEDDGCSGCGGVAADDVDENDEVKSDSDVDVCACCSEWLSKALLCSCQVKKIVYSNFQGKSLNHS